jgi:hypothetical protein
MGPRVPERVQLRDLLAPQLVAFAALEPFHQPADARGQHRWVEGLEDVVDGVEVEPAGAVLEPGLGGKETIGISRVSWSLRSSFAACQPSSTGIITPEQDQVWLLALCQLHAAPPV